MNVAAYLRKTLTGLTVREQYEALEQRARDLDWNLVWHTDFVGANKTEGIKSERPLKQFLRIVRDNRVIKIQGVMFWHASHVAGSLKGFITAIQLIEQYKLAWYVENPRISSNDKVGRLLTTISPDLIGLDYAITQFNLRERSADMKVRGTNPGRKKISQQKEEEIRMLRRNGQNIKEIAHQMKVSYATVYRVLNQSAE